MERVEDHAQDYPNIEPATETIVIMEDGRFLVDASAKRDGREAVVSMVSKVQWEYHIRFLNSAHAVQYHVQL